MSDIGELRKSLIPMKGKTPDYKVICPKCNKEIIDNDWGCISRDFLVCWHKDTEFEIKDKPDIMEDVKWERVEGLHGG